MIKNLFTLHLFIFYFNIYFGTGVYDLLFVILASIIICNFSQFVILSHGDLKQGWQLDGLVLL